MRLSPSDIIHIKQAVRRSFGEAATVYLFGSRQYEEAKGGDIDLLIQSDNTQNLLKKKLAFLSELKLAIGDQKIDVLIRSMNRPADKDRIYQEALKGKRL